MRKAYSIKNYYIILPLFRNKHQYINRNFSWFLNMFFFFFDIKKQPIFKNKRSALRKT